MAKQQVHIVKLTQEDVIDYLLEKKKNQELSQELSINDFAKKLSTDNHEGKIIIADCSGLALKGFNFKGADLRGAIFKGANLEGANLEGANLEGADLRGADLSNASCTNINLTKAKCAGLKTNDGTDLGGAETKGATGKLKHTDIQKETFTRTLKDKVEWDAKVNEWNEDRPRYKKFLDGLSGVFFEQTLTRKVKRRGGALIGAILFGGVAYSLAGALLVGLTIATAGTLPLIIAGITVVSAAAGALIGASKGLTFMTALVAVVMPLKLVSGIATASVALISVLSGQTIQKITTTSLKTYLEKPEIVPPQGKFELEHRQRLKIARASAYRAKARGEIAKAQEVVAAVPFPAQVQKKRPRAQSVIIVRPKLNRKVRKKRRHSSINKLTGAHAVSVSQDSVADQASLALNKTPAPSKSTTTQLIEKAVAVPLPDDDGIGLGSGGQQNQELNPKPDNTKENGALATDNTSFAERVKESRIPASNKVVGSKKLDV